MFGIWYEMWWGVRALLFWPAGAVAGIAGALLALWLTLPWFMPLW